MTLAGLVPRCGWGQVCGLVMMACGGLTDQDGQPRIELSEISSLLVGDSAQVTARLLAADGTPVPAAALRYTSNDPAVLSVDSTGFLRARNVGHADLVVQAAAFAEAVATRSITVRPLLVVDSIRPLEVAFGGLLHLYGVGLEPNPFAIVTVDGTPAPVHDYLPANPAAPNRGGILTIVVPAPAGPRASVGIVGDRGTGAFFGPITVIQQSIFEPNDLRPADLGVVPSGGFIYPLAFTREGAPAWYTFDNPVLQDVTIGVTVAPPIDVTWTLLFDTDVRRAEGDTECPNRRYDHYCLAACGDPSGSVARVTTADSGVIRLARLPAGRYHVLAFPPPRLFPNPKPYRLTIQPGYRGDSPPDRFEGNNLCQFASPIVVPQGPEQLSLNLTIDSPLDADWFSFEVGPQGDALRISVRWPVGADGPSPQLYRDERPDSVRAIVPAFELSDNELDEAVPDSLGDSFFYNLAPGRYLALVFGFAIDDPRRERPYTLRWTRFPGSVWSATGRAR